ncbi:MAG: DUF2505 family protein [Mycobacteriaceae bacterium]|uniref:DUF2505 family protein n=1 Tax=Corynebacterium sp. TaxID=1720 RepID=UPI003F98409F
MAKSVTFNKVIDHPVETVHSVVSSERYLLTVDDEPADGLTIGDTEREVAPDGSVHSRVVATRPAAKKSPELTVEQTTDVTPFADGTFTATTVIPLPKGLGTMTNRLVYTGGADGTTAVEAQVTADIGVPLIGGRLAGKLLGGAEEGIDKSLARIGRQAGQNRT